MPSNIISKKELLEEIAKEISKGKSLPLYRERIKNKVFPVTGEGSQDAKIMFIGEAPGKNEVKSGKPFCGASGRILDELLASVGILRKDVYITNIVKDRPPMNRDPFPDEIDAYGPYLDRQIEIIKPKTIATLGRFSAVYIMNKFGLSSKVELIGNMHGKLFSAKGGSASGGEGSSYGPINIVPLYHPAVAVYNSNTKEGLKKDFEILKDFK
jgi:DNA polymerase